MSFFSYQLIEHMLQQLQIALIYVKANIENVGQGCTIRYRRRQEANGGMWEWDGAHSHTASGYGDSHPVKSAQVSKWCNNTS